MRGGSDRVLEQDLFLDARHIDIQIQACQLSQQRLKPLKPVPTHPNVVAHVVEELLK